MKGKEEKIGAVEGCCVFCLECKSHTRTQTQRHTHARWGGNVNAFKTLEFSCARLSNSL